MDVNAAELLPVLVSALEHWGYCERQCGLIHLEQVFDENIFTLKGRIQHERADLPTGSIEEGRRIERALPIWCDRLGLIGKADVVEFLPDGTPYPVEFKHGPRRRHLHDDLQVCGQALCLEEMLRVNVPCGAVFSITSRRRREVEFTHDLRAATEKATEQIRQMLTSETLPPAVNDKRCRNCAQRDTCLPAAIDGLNAKSMARAVFAAMPESREMP